MGRRGFLGQFEQVVLLSLWRLGDDATGAAIHAEIEARGREEAAITAVYVTLSRLEDKGMVASRRGRPDGSDAGMRKVFTIEARGVEALRRSHRRLERFWRGLEIDAAAEEGS